MKSLHRYMSVKLVKMFSIFKINFTKRKIISLWVKQKINQEIKRNNSCCFRLILTTAS